MNPTPTPEEAARNAAQALLDASDVIATETKSDTEAVARGTTIILTAFAPLLAEKDTEIALLKGAEAQLVMERDAYHDERDAALEVIAKKDEALK